MKVHTPTPWILLVLAGCASTTPLPIDTAKNSLDPMTTRALDYMAREMDVYHAGTVIYDDAETGGNLYYPTGWMGVPEPWIAGRLQLDHSKEDPHSGNTCIRLRWRPTTATSWAGVYWQYPENNWGDVRGHELQGATRVQFWARGETGNEVAEFKFGGIATGVATTGAIRLQREWVQYGIPIEHLDLENVVGAFCWVTNARQNPNGCSIYLDDIEVDSSRLAEPRLIRSYHVDDRELERERAHLRNAAFVYDNAVAICAFLSSPRPEDRRRALLVADALVELIRAEGRNGLSNGYCCGPLFSRRLADDQDSVRPPWRFGTASEGDGTPVLLDAYSMGKDSGNMAWAAIALLACWDTTREERYLEAAQELANWVQQSVPRSLLGLGYRGGWEWCFQDGTFSPISWQSTEHNIDLAVAFRRLAEALPSERERFEAAGDECREFVLWSQAAGGSYLVTGTVAGTKEPSLDPKPLDPQTWALLAFPDDRARFGAALDWALESLFVTPDPNRSVVGLTFARCEDDPRQTEGNVWPEGSAQGALALKLLDRNDEAAKLIDGIEAILSQPEVPTGALGSVVAAYPDEVDTKFDRKYPVLPHLGATAWYVLAKQTWNPFLELGETIRDP